MDSSESPPERLAATRALHPRPAELGPFEAPSLLPAPLVIDLPNWVGDVMMALPALAALVEANQPQPTVLHCRPQVRRLLELLLPGARVVASPRHAAIVPTVRRLTAHGRLDVGLTMRNAWRAKLLLRLIARHAIGSAGGFAAVLLDRSFTIDRSHHQVRDGELLLHHLGLAEPALDLPPLPDSVLLEGRRSLRAVGLANRRPIGLAPSAASGSSKRWPAERYGLLADRLMRRGLEVVVVVGPGEEAVAEAVVDASGRGLAVVGPDVDVAGLAGIMSQLGLLVTNDSGPMHVAALAGTRVVALFGPTDPARTAPLGTGHRTLRSELDCPPCFEPRCPLGHNACLHTIEVGAVERAVVTALIPANQPPAAANG